jgi:RHS repeat-associated protein
MAAPPVAVSRVGRNADGTRRFYWGEFTPALYSTPNYAYWPAPGGTAGEVNGDNSTLFFMHKDWLGSSRLSSTIINHTIVSDQAYAPYGEVYNKQSTGAGQPGWMFTGDTQDILAGLFDTPNRELNPGQGRWLSPDPAGSGWNQYAYPTSFVDPSGLFREFSCGACYMSWGGGQFGGNGDDPTAGGGIIAAALDGDLISTPLYGWISLPDDPSGFYLPPLPGTYLAYWGMIGYDYTSLEGSLGGSDQDEPETTANNGRVPNNITCSTVLPNGRTVGSYVQAVSNQLNDSPIISTPYGPAVQYSGGPLSVYGSINFKIMFQGQANAAFLGDAGNFAYAAVSANIGVALWATEAVAGRYAGWAGHTDTNNPFGMDNSAARTIPSGYSAKCGG